MKKKLVTIIVLFIVIGLFMGLTNEIANKKKNTQEKNSDNVTEEATRTEAFVGVSYTYNEIEKLVLKLANNDTQKKDISRLIDPLSMSENITVDFVKGVVDIIGVTEEVYSEVLTDDNITIVSAEQFDMIYDNIVAKGVVKGLERKNIYVYESFSRNVDDNMVMYISDTCNSYALDTEFDDSYYDSVLDTYIKDGTIIRINGFGDEAFVLDRVWIEESDGRTCTFLYNDLEKTYKISSDSIAIVSQSEESVEGDVTVPVKNKVARITVDNSGVTGIFCYRDSEKVCVTEITDEGFKTKDNGIISRDENFRIYNIYNGVICEDSLNLLLGYEKLELIKDGKKAIAAVINDELYSEKIRVIISNDSYSSYDLKRVELTCDTRVKIVYSEERQAYYEAGDVIRIKYDSYDKGSTILVEPTDKRGRITINTLNRNYGHPSYAGSFEIKLFDDCLHLINIVPLEEYLYSVVSSEMPAGSEPEALKAFSICARGYAYTKMHDESFLAYDAHLDDSSLCQVYNNFEETKQSIGAVKETYGMVPTYEEEVIVPLYFSTSCGVTCTNEEIWGGNAYPYLQSTLETVDRTQITLSDEEKFRKFIDNSLGYEIIDEDMPYYRWHIDYSFDEMTKAVNGILEERISSAPDNIKLVGENDKLLSAKDIETIGDIISVEVSERTRSGVVSKLRLEGKEATIEVTGQTNIRNLLSPKNQRIIRQDNFEMVGWTSLPSPFYYIDKTDTGFTIVGGGFGHGVGMSQNGANVLASMGYNYKYILRHYYTYIDFDTIYDFSDEEEEK